MRVAAKILFTALCFLMPLCTPVPAFAAVAEQPEPERYRRVFGAEDFKIGQDALKYERPDSGMFKIMPRLQDSAVFTRFNIPDETALCKEWLVSATVYSSESPAAGVGLWNGDKGYVFYVFPNGRSRFEYREGNNTTWVSEAAVSGFAFPSKISIERDAGGSVIARVNGVIVSARVLEVNLKKAKPEAITAVSFVTRSTPDKSGAAAYFEKLEVTARGTFGLMDISGKK